MADAAQPTARIAGDRSGSATMVSDGLIVAAEHRHQTAEPGVDLLELAEQRSLTKPLSTLNGGHRPFDPGPLSDDLRWIKQVLAVQGGSKLWERLTEHAGRIDLLQAELATVQKKLTLLRSRLELTERQWRSAVADLEPTSCLLTNMRASTSWRITRPLCGQRTRNGRGTKG